MALRSALQALSFGQYGARLIPAICYQQSSSSFDAVPRRHHVWKSVRGEYGIYPKTTLEPTTDKMELAEMDESDPRHFSEIKALETHEYFSCLQDPLVEKFIRKMLNKRGVKENDRRTVTREIMYNCLELIKHSQLEKYHQATSQEERDAIETNPYKILHGAMENARPLLKMVQVRKGAVLYRVPVPVVEVEQYHKALKWFIEAGRVNNLFEDSNTPQRMATELINAYNNTGKVIRQKQELHKEAEANKAYAHFRWGRA